VDIPFKFTTTKPAVTQILKHFQWRRHPHVPELELFSSFDLDELKTMMKDNGHSWQWPYIWECGAALARFILDNPTLVRDKVVYDLGTGQGTALIAAKKAGAKIAVGVDTCVFSQFTVEVNSERNNAHTLFLKKDILTAKIPDNCVIFASDLVYGQSTSDVLLEKLYNLSETSTVIISQSNRPNPRYEITHPSFYKIQDVDVPVFTPRLEVVNPMPITLYSVGKPLDLVTP